MPVAPTVATVESLEDHWTTPRTSRLFWDGTRTCRVSASSGPRMRRVRESTKSAASTSTGAVAIRPAEVVAWMMLFPTATATTWPEVSTSATSGLSDFQVTFPGVGEGVASSRSAWGVTRIVSPGRRMMDAGSRVSTDPGGSEGWPFPALLAPVPVMRTAIEARFPWSRASTLARPGLTPSTEPSLPTRAISVSELQKPNLAEGMRLPWRS